MRYIILSFFVILLNNLNAQTLDLSLFKNLNYRNIGPFRGGRSLAIAGNPNNENEFYFGAVGGGVWKTLNSGKDWQCISDTVFKSSSVGAIALAASNPKIIYVGMGETDIRGNISFGDGMYKSENSGKNWKKIGLSETYAIANIVVHPTNADIVYVSAMGNVFKPNAERGVFRTKDGGLTWKKVLFKNDSTGCINVQIDQNNPNVLFASMWQAYRTPWGMSSGGKHSGIYKSTDGGDTWVDISKNQGMPKGVLGKICIAISPVNSDRVFAMVENTNGGLFRSDNGGETWLKITEDMAIKQRPWYFSAVYCHPTDIDIVYVLNVAYHKSTDGGKTFSTHWAMHADNHDMWIHPKNPSILAIANDGGGTISTDNGMSWSMQDFPTAQFYHVTLDNQFPYRVYGAQQDNSSVSITSRSFGWQIDKNDWYDCAWGESGYIAPHPFIPGIAFGGNYSGTIYRYDKNLNYNTLVNVYPEDGLGQGADQLKYRFQWTFPIVFSPFSTKEKQILYATSQYVHRSYDEGKHWETISPDLTRNDKSKQQASGGPISKDNTGVEVYNTVFAFAESTLKAGLLWAGSDDGLVHVSTDYGKTWQNVTPNTIEANTQISIIEPSHFQESKVYLAANRFKLGDMNAMIYKSEDYGKTWKNISAGLPKNAATRVIRENPNMPGFLICGTEIGLFMSVNDGQTWQPFNQNIPNTPIADIAFHKDEHDIVIATHGRSFWIMDNISLLEKSIQKQKQDILLSINNPVNAFGGSYDTKMQSVGQNDPCGMIIDYQLPNDEVKEIKINIFNEKGDSLTSFSSLRDRDFNLININKNFYEPKQIKPIGILTAQKGFNRFVWDMRSANITKIEGDGQVLWGASLSGTLNGPGNYKVCIYINQKMMACENGKILANPRFDNSNTKILDAKKSLLDSIKFYVNKTHKMINEIRAIKKQINLYEQQIQDTILLKSFTKISKNVIDTINSVEQELIQSKAKNIQDLLNYPMKLNNKMAALIDKIDAFQGELPQQYFDVYADLKQKMNIQFNKIEKLKNTDIKLYNELAKKHPLDIIKTK